MKKFLILFLFAGLPLVAGNIYKVKYEYQADVKVFVVQYQYQADLLVYEEEYEYAAKGKDEIWHYVNYAYQANAKVYFVDYEYQADVKIYYVKYKYQAGWQKPSSKAQKFVGLFK